MYLLMAHRLRLPITGIGLPGHFICRYQSTAAEIYIDPFHRGKLLSKADCVQYLVHGNFSLSDDYLAPVSARRILLRTCGNLHQIYLQEESAEETFATAVSGCSGPVMVPPINPGDPATAFLQYRDQYEPKGSRPSVVLNDAKLYAIHASAPSLRLGCAPG